MLVWYNLICLLDRCYINNRAHDLSVLLKDKLQFGTSFSIEIFYVSVISTVKFGMLLLLLFLFQIQSTSAQNLKSNFPPPSSRNDIAREIGDLRLYLQEEMLSLRGDMQDMMRDSESSISWLIRDLVREVREYKDQVIRQDHVMEHLKSDLTSALVEVIKVRRIVEASQSEVRLISQHKVTWQNHTERSGDGRMTYPADFLVDGVYRLACGELNPIQHTDGHQTKSNMIVRINLGARFKIHSVKIWNRMCDCQDRAVGILVYADNDLIGAITNVQHTYDFLASDNVFGRTIVLKQPNEQIINLLEVQVFGSGPHYEED